MHFWIAAYPDLDRPIGGIKQMHRVAESIIRLGYSATLIQGSREFHPSWFDSNVVTISKDEFEKLEFSKIISYLYYTL